MRGGGRAANLLPELPSTIRTSPESAVRLSLYLHDAPALSRPTGAGGAVAPILREVVVDGQFFARPDHAQAHVQDMALHDAAHEIGVAAVVDDLGAAAVH